MITRLVLMIFGIFLASPLLAAEPGTGEIKTFTLVSSPTGVTPEHFIHLLQTDYAALASKLPGQRGLIVSTIVKAQPRSDVRLLQVSDFDAVIEASFDSVADQQRAQVSAEGKALDAAMARLVGSARRFVTREREIVPLPAGERPRIVALSFVMRPEGTPQQDFRRKWIEVHGPMAKTVPYLRGFSIFEHLNDGAVPGVPLLEMDGPLEGFTQSWVDDVESRTKMMASAEAKSWYAHGAESFGKIRTDLLIEHVIR